MVSFINVYLLPVVIPGLLAYLVEKSNPNLDAEKLTKNKLFLFLLLTRCVTLVLTIYIYSMQSIDIIWSVLRALYIIMCSVLICLALLVINLVCNSFMAELEEAGDILDIEILIEKYVSLVNKYRAMRVGFSPFLFIIVSFSVVYTLVFSFLLTEYIAEQQFIRAASMVPGVLFYTLLLYYLICFCDECFLTLSANNNGLR